MNTEKPYDVYVSTNESGYIAAVNSSAFVSGDGMTKIDEGYGDKYHHAQANYFPCELMTTGGAYRHKLVDGQIVECGEDEIAAQEATNETAEASTDEVLDVLLGVSE